MEWHSCQSIGKTEFGGGEPVCQSSVRSEGNLAVKHQPRSFVEAQIISMSLSATY
jgi:hypothetical protein